MRGRCAGSSLANFVAEAEGLRDWEHGEDGEEGGAFLERLGDDAAATAGDDAVDAAKDFGLDRGQWVFLRLGNRKGGGRTYWKPGSRSCTWPEEV